MVARGGFAASDVPGSELDMKYFCWSMSALSAVASSVRVGKSAAPLWLAQFNEAVLVIVLSGARSAAAWQSTVTRAVSVSYGAPTLPSLAASGSSSRMPVAIDPVKPRTVPAPSVTPETLQPVRPGTVGSVMVTS